MKHEENQKQRAVTDYLNGISVVQIAQNVGVSRSTIYTWIRMQKENGLIKTVSTQKEAMNLKQNFAKLQDIVSVLKQVGCTTKASLYERLLAAELLYGKYSVYVLCDALNIARGTFYNHLFRNKRGNSSFAKKREEVRIQIQNVFDENGRVFGARKIQVILINRGYRVSEKIVAELMRDMGLSSMRVTAKKDHEKRWRKEENRNILQRQFNVKVPNQVWVSDITYFKCNDVSYYICVIIDLFSRKVVSYRVSQTNSTQMVTATFKHAQACRKADDGLVFHSDRGLQYMSHTFRKVLDLHHAIQSLSAPGQPHDNAVAESFFASMKKEALYRKDCKNKTEVLSTVKEYVRFYNNERPHTALGYKTALQFEDQYYKGIVWGTTEHGKFESGITGVLTKEF
jgi:transposase InsO family protein/transposase-like protein